MPIGIITALAGLEIEVAANHIGEFDRFRFGVPQFDEAAFGTAIAQGFPFFTAHLLKGFLFPEIAHGLFGSFVRQKEILLDERNQGKLHCHGIKLSPCN